MKKAEFSALLAQIGALSVTQKVQPVAALEASDAPEPLPMEIIDNEFSGKPVCPSCSSESVHKWGIASGLQRYTGAKSANVHLTL